MAAKTDPNFGIQYGWDPRESGWNTGMDDNLKKLGALVMLAVLSRTTTAQPSSPTEGERYIVPASATGSDWSGQDGSVALYQDGAWSFYRPANGWTAYVADNDERVTYNAADGWHRGQIVASQVDPGEAKAGEVLAVQDDGSVLFSTPYAPTLGFRAHATSAQTGIGSGDEVIIFDTVDFENPDGWYDPSTGRFTPQLAGWYSVAGTVCWGAGGAGERKETDVFKNGSLHSVLQNNHSATAAYICAGGSAMVYLNGTTDYTDIRASSYGGSDDTIADNSAETYAWANYIGP